MSTIHSDDMIQRELAAIESAIIKHIEDNYDQFFPIIGKHIQDVAESVQNIGSLHGEEKSY
jgi:hypothetical protein